jgi:chromosome segregation ATPase
MPEPKNTVDDAPSFLARVKGAFFEEEHPKPPDKSAGAKTAQKTTAHSAAIPVYAGTVNNEDRLQAIKVLAERVMTGNTPYVEYRATFDALEGTVTPDDNRRRAALAVVSKKYGIEKVAQAILSHKNTLAEECATFEQSIGSTRGGPIEACEKDIASKEQSIQTKRAEIERLTREIEDLEQGKKASEGRITEERAKHEHAKAVFGAAFKELSSEIDADEQLINSQLPKGA